jgi:tetratricopeptide (TPR) repeat protein
MSIAGRWHRPALLFAAVFAVKLVVALQFDRHPLLQPDAGLDTTAYVALAKRVAAGDIALGPGLYYVSPLYLYFLALVYALTKSFTAARVVQAALGTVAVALIFLTAREWFGRRAGWLAAGLAGVCGVFTYYEALLLQSSLDVVLTAATLWLLTLAVKRDAWRWPLLAGILFGVASLNRPNMIVPAIVIVALLLVRRRLRTAALLFAGLVAGLAPVTIRNAVVAHQFALVSSHGGINFYIGNGEGATGYFHAVPGMRSSVEGLAFDARRVAETASGRTLSDADVSSYYSGLAWSWIRSHPFGWMRLLVWKLYAVLNTAHISTPFSYTFYAYDAGTLLRVLVIGPWLIVPLGLLGLLQRRTHIVWLSFVPAYAASLLLFFITERYKLPLFVACAIAAGAGIEALIKKPRAWTLAAFALLLVAANWRLPLDDGRAEERTRMAETLTGRGEFGEAERWARLALATPRNPFPARAEYALGRALLGAGRPAEAVGPLRDAIQHRVSVPLAGYDLAVALQQTGDPAGAARALSKVRPPDDSDVVVWLQLGRRAAEINAPDVAEPFLRRAVAVGPANAAAHQMLAIDLLVLARFEEASQQFIATLRLQPRNADALAMLAVCEQRLGRLEDARRHAEAALAIAPRHPIAQDVLKAASAP